MDNELKDWEEMRRQMDVLKQKLERQQIINDNTLRRAIRGKTGAIRRRLVASCAIAGFAAIYCPITLHDLGASWAFCLVTSAFLLLAIGYTLYERWGVRSAWVEAGNLVEMTRRVSRMKRLERIWQLRVGIPFIIVWFPWLCCEIVMSHDEGFAYLAYLISSLALGGIIGGLVGWRMYKHNMRDADDILDHIKELTDETGDDERR